jgi:hypothetical protein
VASLAVDRRLLQTGDDAATDLLIESTPAPLTTFVHSTFAATGGSESARWQRAAVVEVPKSEQTKSTKKGAKSTRKGTSKMLGSESEEEMSESEEAKTPKKGAKSTKKGFNKGAKGMESARVDALADSMARVQVHSPFGDAAGDTGLVHFRIVPPSIRFRLPFLL